ncbi:50S ribosomal protein L9 [Thermoanaerobacterium saccharolyticum]|jgi:large subunit ribosomal protein L9|uniref:50S ribosomal protein L9 n=1 Tax=Thermoanaerobacterium TaxID=28895 RepID=UPI0005F0AB88|nr:MULTISPECIES: 50S ribosomal protein L9 [unclassified Thermoanaerobacterium]MDE4542968.1 50S ribosomal protein L9 [Thermoanaerobacterium sp. R66]ORX22757.1 50S ribosomal protein L9 [Thermoanaerobacterium sp. PSU-2]HHV74524.1 50S ribosomal protein L9 [Thermoanaerobacterium sp.]
MKVILQKDVKGIGKAGDVVNVSDGYGRNYLLPRGLAIDATKSNINVLNEKKKAEEKKRQKEVEAAQEMAKKLSQESIVLKVKTGENGKLFGSITSKDIQDELNKKGYDIDKKKINLPDSIKTIGTYNVDIKIYPGIQAKVKVDVVGQ